MNKNFTFLLFALLFPAYSAIAQSSFTLSQDLRWAENPRIYRNGEKAATHEIWTFDGAIMDAPYAYLPQFQHRFTVDAASQIRVEWLNVETAPIRISASKDAEKIGQNFGIQAYTHKSREQSFGYVRILPIRKTATGFEKLVRFELRVTVLPNNNAPLETRGGFTRVSKMSDGDIYKFALKQTGVYKLDLDFFKNQLKIPNIENIDPNNIKILGNGGGMLPEINKDNRLDDLNENPTETNGGGDGKFDAGDFVVFYATGTDRWLYDASQNTFDRPKNIYDNQAYYFVKIGGGASPKLTKRSSITSTDYETSTFDDVQRFEEDKVNLLAYSRNSGTSGSGKQWFGDYFSDNTKSKTYTNILSFPNIEATEPVQFNVRVAAASETATNVVANVNGKIENGYVFEAYPNLNDERFANATVIGGFANATGDNATLQLTFENTGRPMEGWLDYVQMQARRQLRMTNDGQTQFQDLRSRSRINTRFRVANVNTNTLIWDISNPQTPIQQNFDLTNNEAIFGAATAVNLRQFVVFDRNATLLKPTAVIGKVANQNLHALDNLDMLIVYHKNFETAAQTLAQHRRSFSNYNVATVEIQQLYNEFSSGGQDLAAIRDMTRMLYTRSPKFKFLLLLGDGSFDARNIYPLGDLASSNFIPAYETDESFQPVEAFPSDDFFALLDPDEGFDLRGGLDVAVGRIPCKTADEANNVIKKIIHYDSNPKSLGDWRNRMLMSADDGDDAYQHLQDAETFARMVEQRQPVFNLEKLYVDAFQHEVNAGGVRVPTMNEAFYNNQYQGFLLMAYAGHGGSKGLAQERILLREDLETWRNYDKLPLLVTATCSFAGFDNYKEVTAGEAALLNAQGGAIALFSTTRAVYASTNLILVASVFDTLLNADNDRGRLVANIGDLLRIGKNISGLGSNSQKFMLLGDPAMRLAFPKLNVVTKSINGRIIDSTLKDTARAMQRITISGSITDGSGVVQTNFNGRIYPTVFDKPETNKTLGQPITVGSGGLNTVTPYQIQRNVLFKGAATVTNGRWTFSFTVPRDINYTFGKGKVSYYAENGTPIDAAGFYNDLVIGGSDPRATADDKPPLVQVFMNDEKFVFGGMTDQNPAIYAKISDDNGINITGISVGHDLTGTIDNTTQTIKLNNFFQATLDDSRKGTVRYPLNKIAAGEHTIHVKAWDIANNSGEGETKFFVTSDAKSALSHVLNYPNPFTTNTRFQFEHNLTAQTLRVQVNIFTVAGKLVKTIQQDIVTEGYRVTDLNWDGKDDYGDELARGVYLYQVKVNGVDKDKPSRAVSEFEKLVILK